MNILFLCINYAPEKTSVSPFNTGLCEHLAKCGHEVTVVTAFPYYPEWRIWDGYRGKLYAREIINGVKVNRVLHFIPWRASSLIQRLLHDFSFSLGAFFAGLRVADFDVVCCSSPPPALALASCALGALRRRPTLLKLTDLASDAALATGILGSSFLARIAQSIEGFIYRHTDKVICLCQPFVEKLIAGGISADKLELISDWGDTARIVPGPRVNSFRRTHGIPADKFLALHTGNMGKKQDLVNIIRAAEACRAREDILFAIVGEGEDRPLLEREFRARDLKNLVILPLQPAESLPAMYSAADVLLLNQKATIQDAVIPSKLLTYLAAGRPVIAAASPQSAAARLVMTSGCGLVVEPENPAALVDGIAALQADADRHREYGLKGRSYAEAHFTREHVLRHYSTLLACYDRHVRAEPPVVSATAAGTSAD